MAKHLNLEVPEALEETLTSIQKKLDLPDHGAVISHAIHVLDILCKSEGTVTLSVTQKKAEELGITDVQS